MTMVRASVPRPKRARPRLSSWPSWAIAVAGASVPVANAIATGKASSTATRAGLAGPVMGALPWWIARRREAQGEHRDGGEDEQAGHDREDQPAAVAEQVSAATATTKPSASGIAGGAPGPGR